MFRWRRRVTTIVAGLCLPWTVLPGVAAGQHDARATADVLAAERRFWEAYNACDAAAIRQLLADDIEFYHDKGGATFGSEALTATVQANLCSGPVRVRRAGVEATIQAFPLRRDGVLYGAVVRGDHLFHTRTQDRPETLDGAATFTHLWRLDGGEWKMSRVLSYGHGPPASPTTPRTAPPAPPR